LKWSTHIQKLTGELNFALAILRRLKSQLGFKELRTIAEGIFMSRIRYALPVFAAEFLRLDDSEPTSGHLQRLQKCQNEMLRTITGKKRRDHVKIADMLQNVRILSINQLIGYGTLMEAWKAREFQIPVLGTLLDRHRDDDRTLRSDSSNSVSASKREAYSQVAEKLWNLSSQKFRNTNLTKVAKSEAKKLALSLPL